MDQNTILKIPQVLSISVPVNNSSIVLQGALFSVVVCNSKVLSGNSAAEKSHVSHVCGVQACLGGRTGHVSSVF